MKKYDLSNAAIGLKKNTSFWIHNLSSQINERFTENLLCSLFGWRKLESNDIDALRHFIDGD